MRCFQAVLLVIGLAGCGGSASNKPLLDGLPEPGDAPYELSSDGDLDAQRALFDALGPGAKRDRLRARLAREYSKRVAENLDLERRDEAYAAFQRLVGLWQPSEIESGRVQRALAPHRDLLLRLRGTFARAGADHQTCGALYVLAAIDAKNAPRYLGELEEIFAYADQLNVAEYGDGAQRARPIEILEGVAQFFPEKAVVDRLVLLSLERQKAIDSRIRRSGADFNLIRAHGAGVLKTSWRIAALLAKAGRLGEAPKKIAMVSGVGDDPDLRRLLQRALSSGAHDKDWISLARYFRAEQADKSDLEAELAILTTALAKRPNSATLRIAAGNTAFELERIPLAVHHFEAGLARSAKMRRPSERLAALYENQVISLALGARVKAATERLAKFEEFHERAKEVFSEPLTPDLADAYAAMGQGLVSLGDLERARRYLRKSIEERPTFAALEFLGTIELKRGRYDNARHHFDRALAIPIKRDRQQFRYNKILRLAGQAALGQGKNAEGKGLIKRAMNRWEQIVAKYDLTNDLLAQLLLETAKLQWMSESKETAMVAFEASLKANSESEGLVAEIVAFLIGRNQYREALDIYHRALPNPKVGDEIKVYMSLWMIAEAKFNGLEVDPFARDFIASRRGGLWEDQLSRFADGRIPMSALRRRATTRRRQSELLFYDAVIHKATENPAQARDLLERVEAGSMIMDFEYELAKRWLSRGLNRSR